MSLEVVGLAVVEAIRGDEPTNAREVVSAFGGAPAVARLMVGLPAQGKLPAAGTGPRKAYNAAIRRVQRWVTTAGERRTAGWAKLDPDVRRQLVEAAWDAQARGRAGELAKNGARARLSGLVKVDSPGIGKADVRRRSLPSGGPGVALGRDDVIGFAQAALAGDAEDAGRIFMGAFLDSYGMGADVELEEVDALTLWPEGTLEGEW